MRNYDMPGDDTMMLTPTGWHAQTRNGPMSRNGQAWNGTTPASWHETALQAACKACFTAVGPVGMGHARRRLRAAKQDCATELCAARIASLQAPRFPGFRQVCPATSSERAARTCATRGGRSRTRFGADQGSGKSTTGRTGTDVDVSGQFGQCSEAHRVLAPVSRP